MKNIATAIFLFLASNALGQLYSTGLIFNDKNYKSAQIKANLNSDEFNNLPTSATLKQYCPKPGNQLQLNTSPSWAVSWSAQSILAAKRNKWTNVAVVTQNTYSPAFNYFHVRSLDDERCENGVDLYDALSFLKQNGSKQYDEFLEFCPRGIPKEILRTNNLEPISDFIKLFTDEHTDAFKINAIKKSLVENYPVVIGMYCPPSFYRAKEYWQPNELFSTDFPGHALCIIGYDDDKYGGSFEIMNSWGSRWADSGFTWIRYADLLTFTKYAYEIINIDKSESGTYDFSCSVELKLNDNSNIELSTLNNGVFKTTEPLSTGTYFRVYLKNNSPAFVYVFGIDEREKLFRVFPDQDSISPAVVYKTNIITIPSEDSYIEIVDDPGRENLCILYSKVALDFNQLLYNLEKYPGDVYQNIDALLNGTMIPANAISWKNDGIEFNATSKDKAAIFIQIQIDHI